jgi:hypothetical protein
MDALAGHPEPDGHLRDRLALHQHLKDGLIALLHQPELHQHDADLLQPATFTVTSEEGSDPPGADAAV